MRLHGPYVYGTPHIAGNPAPCPAAHAAKIGLAGFPAPLTRPDTPAPSRTANAAFFFIGPSGPSGGGHFEVNPAPCPAAHAAKIGLAGFPAALTLRGTPHPAVPPALHFLFIGPSGPSGGGHFAGNPAPCPAASAAKIGLRAGLPFLSFPSLYKTPLYKSIFPIS